MSISGNVLVIDDEASLRHTLTRILRRAGCDVTSAAGGPEALRLLTQASYDLVYLDLRLPEMDGIQVLKEIRRIFPRLPVILLTGHGSLQSALEAIHLGATAYLLKPIDPTTLIDRTQAVLREQAIERRRQEIQSQIEVLQNELRALDIEHPPPAPSQSVATGSPDERFLKCGKLVLDLQARHITIGEDLLSLPPTTYDYLVVLAKHAPDVVDYQTLVSEAQGYQTDPNSARELAKWHIYVIRRAIEDNPKKPRQILNIRGVGYRLLVD